MGPDEQWHLSKSVPVSIILFLAFQTIGAVWWAAKMDSRVSVLEAQNPIQDARLVKLEDLSARIAVMEDRQKRVLERLDIQTRTMQEVLTIVGRLAPNIIIPNH